ncbi:UBX domain-containing protein 4 isoform X2 [Anthonomus grandis grandis]|uniref:UBX domain-containing protein 4 isoform X2 n=1 Tax=Anthonomus grandis grandis TaxID=2921223 RepID=UPI0021651622|nr:UBX domain-containing protein 4 isoform X2 [Anthonomus grandis grandis]
MRWYQEGIAEAIQVSKAKGAIFVIYIEGKDEKSQALSNFIETGEVESRLESENFVAIKVEADSVPHKQFCEFYKQTPVPSIYFIGEFGYPLKIITDASDASGLSKEIDEVLVLRTNNAGAQSSTQNSASASQNLIASEQTDQKPSDVVCENGVCTIKRNPEPLKLEEQTPVSSSGDQDSLTAEQKVERAKKLMEMRKIEKEREERELEKEKELERRKAGQAIQNMKKWQEDQELKQLKEEREKEKRLEREAKERVLAQIAQDKAERAAKFQPTASSTPTLKENEKPAAVPSTSKSDSNTARLQFKMPDGTSKTQDFPSTDKLQSVVNFVKANFNLAANKFTLSTTFPRRQFGDKDFTETLADLQLTPNAVILVLPLNRGTVSTSQGPGGLSGFLFALLAPFIGIFNFIKSFLGFGGDAGHVSGDEPGTSRGYTGSGNRQPSNGPSSTTNETKAFKKQGNIRRLTDIRKDDDEDKTWNGNSTQQM